MTYEMKDITGIVLNWKTARMSRGAVLNLQKAYPDLKEIIIGDDGSLDEGHGDYSRAYNRAAYSGDTKRDLDNDKLRDIPGTRFIEFPNHQGHGLTIDRILKYVETPLMLTMDSDMRVVGPGLLEEYLEKYNEDPENIYAVGTQFSDPIYGRDGEMQFTWVDPFFSLWNMEPIKRYERFTFSNFIGPMHNHWGTAAMYNWMVQHIDEVHSDRPPYKPVIYPDPDRIPQLWHLRRFPDDPDDHIRSINWEKLMDG